MPTYRPRHRRDRFGRTASGINAGMSGVFAAATAICAVGFLTVPTPAQADPMLPLAPTCQYGFTGDFKIQQSNGAVVHLNTNGPFELVGVAHATGTGGSGNGTMDGTVSGGLSGTKFDFTIRWNSGPIGKYTGVVEDGGFTRGSTFDAVNPESRATWGSFEALQCVTPPAAPAPKDAPAPIPAPQVPATAVVATVINGPSTLQAGLTGTYVVTVGNSGGAQAPVELFITFGGKLEQTGQISAKGGFDCVPETTGANARVRCVQQLAPGATSDIVVQGVGRAPGQGTLATLGGGNASGWDVTIT